jgi:hypothetical protein
MVIIRGAQSSAGLAGMPEAWPGIDALHARAAGEFGDEVAAGRIPSIRAIRARLRVGQSRAQQVQAYLTSCTH